MIAIGSDTVSKVYLGDQSVLSIALGTNLVYEKSSGPTLLDYIEFDPSMNLPYFDTGIYQSDDLVVEVSLSANGWNDICPCFGGGCESFDFGSEYKYATRVFGLGSLYVDGRGRSVLSQPSFDQGMNTLSINFGGQGGRKITLWNGTQLGNGNPNGNLDTTYKVCINAWLARPGETSPDVNSAGIWRMGYFKIWQGGQLVRDFRPYGSTLDTHLWDEVTRTEYVPVQGTCTGGYITPPPPTPSFAFLRKDDGTMDNIPLFSYVGDTDYPTFVAKLSGETGGYAFFGFWDDDDADLRLFNVGSTTYMDYGEQRASGSSGSYDPSRWNVISCGNCWWSKQGGGSASNTPTTKSLSGVVGMANGNQSGIAVAGLSVYEGGNLTHEYVPISDDVYGPGLSDAVEHTKHFPEDSTGAWHYEES